MSGGIREKNDFFSDKYLNINSCGRYFNADYKIFRKNGRSDYHFLYVKSGNCTVMYKNKKYMLNEGNFVIYYPGQTQEYAFDKIGCTTLWTHFSGRAVFEILSELKINPGVYESKLSENAVVIFEELIREFYLNHYMHKSAENALFIYLMTMVSRHIHVTQDISDIEKVIMLMNMQFDAKYDSQMYSKMCSLSKSRFSHKFKEVTGIVPSEYFINLKIKKAKELLASSDLTVAEISERVGYDNPLYFSRLFKKYTNASPTQYRSENRKN